ncbi:predicted protein [Streptomyces viridosporus ATCC 14672]|uniref:Predicted protein n=1 Tax=Streptomyces viridosporus (strain ATCC 14672 / DSM 40746 / JCM 4963 / KCTC 9882 / NRRL B-12104 / FH 1290) TaxID=566461 RepID=D5ZNZ3_STRV1|nr:predicted protein [Streptomyces viridosporus ATCC 14672]
MPFSWLWWTNVPGDDALLSHGARDAPQLMGPGEGPPLGGSGSSRPSGKPPRNLPRSLLPRKLFSFQLTCKPRGCEARHQMHVLGTYFHGRYCGNVRDPERMNP